MTCEWNPDQNRALFNDEEPHAKAVWCVGAKGEWHLCDKCVNLSVFKKYRRRHRLNDGVRDDG